MVIVLVELYMHIHFDVNHGKRYIEDSIMMLNIFF